MMQAGKLRHYVTIERSVRQGTGDRGQKVAPWLPLHSDLPAEVVPLGGRLLEIKRQLVPTATHEIRIRHEGGLKAGECRARYEVDGVSRYFAIGYVDETDFKRHELRLVCTEVTGET